MKTLPKNAKQFVSVLITCVFFLNTVAWGYPQTPEKFNLATQSIFNPLEKSERRDIGIAKYLLMCLGESTNLKELNKEARMTIGKEKIDVSLEFQNGKETAGRFGLRDDEYFIPCVIGKKTYYAYVSVTDEGKIQKDKLTIFTQKEVDALEEAFHARRRAKDEVDIDHETNVDTPLTITHGKDENIKYIEHETRIGMADDIIRFFEECGASSDFTGAIKKFMGQETAVAFVPAENSIMVGGVEIEINIKITAIHESDRYINIPVTSEPDAGEFVGHIVHALGAKAGLDHDTNNKLEQAFKEYASANSVGDITDYSAIEAIVKKIRMKQLSLVPIHKRDLHAKFSVEERISQTIQKARDIETVDARIAELERIDSALRLLPLAVDAWRESGKADKAVELLSVLIGEDVEGTDLVMDKCKVLETQWTELYQAMAESYRKLDDTWRAISAYNAALLHGLDMSDADMDELVDLYSKGTIFLSSDEKGYLKKALRKPKKLRHSKDKFDQERYEILTKVVAYHDMMSRNGGYTLESNIKSASTDNGVKNYAETFYIDQEKAARLLAQLVDKLNDVPDQDGKMKPFAGVEILDNPYEITGEPAAGEKIAETDKDIFFDQSEKVQVKNGAVDNRTIVRRGDVARRLDIMAHGQWFAYRTYDFRAAFKTTKLELPGVKEDYPALISDKLIFWSAIELGRTMLDSLGFKDDQLTERVNSDPELRARLESKVSALVSGGCRLPIQEHRDAFALGLLYSGVNVFLVKSDSIGHDRAREWMKEDVANGQLKYTDLERVREIEHLFEEKGIISTPAYYLITNLLWNDGMRVGQGREELLKAYEDATHLMLGGGHGTASHNPWEFSGWKQMLSWYRIVLKADGTEGTLPQVLSINDDEMQGLKEGIISVRSRRPKAPQEQTITNLSAVEVAYMYYLYSTAYIRLGRDVWGWLWNRALGMRGGVKQLILATRQISWDDSWDKIRKAIADSLSFGAEERKEFESLFVHKPVLCKTRPFEGLPKIGLGYQHGSAGLAQMIFRSLGLDVEVVHDDPNGMFPDGEPYPNIPWFVRRAMAHFEKANIEIAIIGDEDNDRQICWLPLEGKMVQGDELMAIYAHSIAQQEIKRAADRSSHDTDRYIFYCEVKFYSGFKILIENMKKHYWKTKRIRLHIDVIEGPVGFGYVKDSMKETDRGVMAGKKDIHLFKGRGADNAGNSGIIVNLRHEAKMGGGAEVSGHGMEPLSGAEMSEVEIVNKVLLPIVMAKESEKKVDAGAFFDVYNKLPKSFASPEVRVGTHHAFGRYEKDVVVKRVLKEFLEIVDKKWGLTYQGTKRQYKETVDGETTEYGSLYHIYGSDTPVTVEIGGMTLHNVTVGIDYVDGAKYYITCDEAKDFTFFLNRKSNTQNEIITRVDGDNVAIRNALAIFMYGLYEKVDAKDLLVAGSKEEAAVALSRDLWIVYEILPRLAYEKLPVGIQSRIDEKIKGAYQAVMLALAEKTLTGRMKIEHRDELGYFYSFTGERGEGFNRIVSRTRRALTGVYPQLISEEQDLGELVDTFLGNRLGHDIGQDIRDAYGDGISATLKGLNTEAVYGYDEEGRLGLELLAARYINRRVKDMLMERDVSRLRAEIDLPNIEKGRTLLINAQHKFEVIGTFGDIRKGGYYLAKFHRQCVGELPGVPDKVAVIIRPVRTDSGQQAMDAGTYGPENVVTFDPKAIVDDRHTGLLVTTSEATLQLVQINLIKGRAPEVSEKFAQGLQDLLLNTEDDEKILLALDTGLGKEGTATFIRQLIDLISDKVGDNQAINKIWQRLVVETGTGSGLATSVSQYIAGEKGEAAIPAKNVIMVTHKDNDENCQQIGEQGATITYIGDSQLSATDYYPFVEVTLFTIAKALNKMDIYGYDEEALVELFKTLPGVDLSGLSQRNIIKLYIENKVVTIDLQPIDQYDQDHLRDTYQHLMKALTAA